MEDKSFGIGMIIDYIFKIKDMIRTSLILVSLLTIAGCYNLLFQRGGEAIDSNAEKTVISTPPSSEISYQERKIRFQNFADSLNKAAVLTESDNLYQEARLFLPDTTLRSQSYLFGKRLARRDTLEIFFYEISQENTDGTSFNLVSFYPDGRAIDLIAVHGKTNDANLGISLIDQEIFELTYVDFYLSPEYFSTDRYADAPDSVKILQSTQHTAMQDYIWKKDYNETNLYENYRLNQSGKFEKLSRKQQPSLSRKFPFTSTKVLATDEIERYAVRDLQLMINEIYADYGKIFSSKKLNYYFKKKSWYQPQTENVDHLLSDVERLNIQKIQSRIYIANQ